MKHFFLFATILASFHSADAAEDCNRILSNRISSAIQNLAELRKDLDLKIANGDSGMMVRTLNNAFQLKQKEIIALGLTEQDLDQRLRNEIQKSSSQPIESLAKVKKAQLVKEKDAELRIGNSISIDVRRYHHATILLNDGRVMFVGGEMNRTAYPPAYAREIAILDPDTNQVEVLPVLSAERESPLHHVLADGRVLVWGGKNLEGISSLVEIIDPVAKTVTKASFEFEGDSLRPVTNTGIVIQGKLLLDQENATMFLWDPITGEKEKYDVHSNRSKIGYSKYDDESIIVSGGNSSMYTANWVFKYHFPTRTQTSLGELKKQSASHMQVSTPSGRILTFGGGLNEKAHSTDIQSFNPATQKSRAVGHLSGPRAESIIVPVSGDRALIVGGNLIRVQFNQTPVEYVNSVELLDLKRGTAELVGYTDSDSRRPVISAMLLPDESILVISEGAYNAGMLMQKIWIGKR